MCTKHRLFFVFVWCARWRETSSPEACDEPLVRKKPFGAVSSQLSSPEGFGVEQNETTECPICFDDAAEFVGIGCVNSEHHQLCSECAVALLNITNPICPLCRGEIRIV